MYNVHTIHITVLAYLAYFSFLSVLSCHNKDIFVQKQDFWCISWFSLLMNWWINYALFNSPLQLPITNNLSHQRTWHHDIWKDWSHIDRMRMEEGLGTIFPQLLSSLTLPNQTKDETSRWGEVWMSRWGERVWRKLQKSLGEPRIPHWLLVIWWLSRIIERHETLCNVMTT